MNIFEHFCFTLFRTFFMTALIFISAILLMAYVVMLISKENYISAVCLTVFGLPITAVILNFIWEFINNEN